MMRLPLQRVFRLSEENRPLKDLTVSQTFYMDRHRHATVFSFGADTEISTGYYTGSYLYYVVSGKLLILPRGEQLELLPGQAVLFAPETERSLEAPEDTVFLEIEMEKKEDLVMKLVKLSEVFSLKDLLPVQPGKIVNADLVNNDAMKIVVMSFDEGCALPEHAAPGEALIFALEGEGEILDGEAHHKILAGENYSFLPGGLHSVRALTPFKMCLILVKTH